MNKQILEVLNRLFQYTALDVCKTISLATNSPEIFNISNKELLISLLEYEGQLSNQESISNEELYEEEDPLFKGD